MPRRQIGMTRGRALLLAVLQLTSARHIAARCRLYPQRVTDWANGRDVPSAAHRAALEREYRIPAESWIAPTR